MVLIGERKILEPILQGYCKQMREHVQWAWYLVSAQYIIDFSFPRGWVVKNPAANAGDKGDSGSIPG